MMPSRYASRRHNLVKLSLIHGTLCPKCRNEPKKVYQPLGENCFRALERNPAHEEGARDGYGG